MEKLLCPFRKEIINNGWGGGEGYYPTYQLEQFCKCVEDKCMAWNYGCRLINHQISSQSSLLQFGDNK